MAFSEGYKWNFQKKEDIWYTNTVLDDRINWREYSGSYIFKENEIASMSDSRHDFRNQKKLNWEQFSVQLSVRLRNWIDVRNFWKVNETF